MNLGPFTCEVAVNFVIYKNVSFSYKKQQIQQTYGLYGLWIYRVYTVLLNFIPCIGKRNVLKFYDLSEFSHICAESSIWSFQWIILCAQMRSRFILLRTTETTEVCSSLPQVCRTKDSSSYVIIHWNFCQMRIPDLSRFCTGLISKYGW